MPDLCDAQRLGGGHESLNGRLAAVRGIGHQALKAQAGGIVDGMGQISGGLRGLHAAAAHAGIAFHQHGQLFGVACKACGQGKHGFQIVGHHGQAARRHQGPQAQDLGGRQQVEA